jgi:hypothetical protein
LPVIFLLHSLFSYSQTRIQGLVKDSKTNEALAYCSIAVKGTKKCTMTNGDGSFSLSVSLTKDSVLFSYVGYETRIIAADRLFQKSTVLLERKHITLQEFTLHATNDYLYGIVDQCRKKIMKDQAEHIAKVYYGIETQSKDQPIEQLECYYNGTLNGIFVDKLLLKNGRIALAGLDSRYFLTLNSSKAISTFNLTDKSEYYPSNPFSFGKREMKKQYNLELESSDDKMYTLKFRPRDGQNTQFSGKAWIDKATYSLLKTDLHIENTVRHPFLPIAPSDSLYNVDMVISRTFRQEGNVDLPDHINFSYRMTYKDRRDSVTASIPPVLTREIITSGVMYFYDYDSPFILPYFEYDASYDDYRKISIIPYNDDFWNNTNNLLLTKKQKENLGFFSHSGYLINFNEGNYGKDFLHPPGTASDFNKHDEIFYEDNYTFWSPNKRISLNKKIPQTEIYSQEKINSSILANLYRLKVQILLDVTQLDESLKCRSYTVFDAVKTFYHLPEQPCTNAFLNIYFDICEVERRKMEKELNAHSYSVTGIDSIYRKTTESIENITRQYLKEVQLGKNEKSLIKWNRYIVENLGIDNLKIFQTPDNGH